MPITKQEVEYIANLARLEISDEEAQRFTGEMEDMIGFANQLSGLDTGGVPPFGPMMGLFNVFREDVPGASYPTELLLANAPEQEDGCYLVPKTLKVSRGGNS